MPRSGANIYSKPGGTSPTNGGTTDATAFNLLMDDIAADLNTPRPIVAGGTGAATAAAGLANLGGLAAASNLAELTAKPTAAAALRGYATTATAGAVTTLTVASVPFQVFTGVLAHTVTLPVTTTLPVGWFVELSNNSTGAITVQSSGGNAVGTIPAGMAARVVCIVASGTTAASWDFDYCGFGSVSGTGSSVFSVAPYISQAQLFAPRFFAEPALVAGTNAQGQGPMTGDLVVVATAAANPSGVTLPSATDGRRVYVVNRGANPVNVFPASGAAINGLAANASIQVPVGGTASFNAVSSTLWLTFAVAADQATWSAGADTTEGTITPAKLAGAITAQSKLTLKYVATPVSAAVNTTYTFTHGLGVVPTVVTFSLVCTTAERGWLVGDEILFSSGSENYNSNVAPAVAVNSTTIKVRTADDLLRTIGMDGSTRNSLTPSRWSLKVTAYA